MVGQLCENCCIVQQFSVLTSASTLAVNLFKTNANRWNPNQTKGREKDTDSCVLNPQQIKTVAIHQSNQMDAIDLTKSIRGHPSSSILVKWSANAKCCETWADLLLHREKVLTIHFSIYTVHTFNLTSYICLYFKAQCTRIRVWPDAAYLNNTLISVYTPLEKLYSVPGLC